MQIFQCLDHLKNVIRWFFFGKSTIWRVCQFFIDFSSMTILKDQIDFLIVPKPSIDLTNIFMMQMTLNFNFIFYCILCLILNYLLFKKCFQYYNKFWFHLPCQVYLAKLAPAQRLADFKIINLPFLWLKALHGLIFSF